MSAHITNQSTITMSKNQVNYRNIKVICTCGNEFHTRSTYESDTLLIEVCSKCHNFYTGQQKIMDVSGRVESFNKRFKS